MKFNLRLLLDSKEKLVMNYQNGFISNLSLQATVEVLRDNTFYRISNIGFSRREANVIFLVNFFQLKINFFFSDCLSTFSL